MEMKKNDVMTRLSIALFLAVAAMLAPSASLSQAKQSDDGAMQATEARTKNITVGRGPEAIVYDGASIWVANQFSNNVTKLRAKDGVVLGT